MNDYSGRSAFCPLFHKAVELIGRRWTGAILREMLDGRQRFSDIAAAVPGLSDRLLSERLKELEAEGLVSRSVLPETPVRIEYHLTQKGQDLASVMDAISEWAGKWLADEFAVASVAPSTEAPRDLAELRSHSR
jgi:DNA-binding HxlR family transcriptional regulator